MRALVLVAGCWAAGAVSAESKELLPEWEVGAGLAYAHLPDYRGSDETRSYLLPFPLLVYRGDFFKSDREGVRAQFLDSRYFELELSAGATVPVSSKKNHAREGMPSLRPTLELGPALKVHVAHIGEARPGERDLELDLRVPVRFAVTWQDGGPRNVGLIAFPSLALDQKLRFAGSRWNLGMLAGGYFADRRYHEYFYGVKPEFATPERPAYTAPGGFSGWSSVIALSTTYGRTWVGGFVKGDWYNGAAFEDSPLLRQRKNFSFGFGVSHILATSDRQVEVMQ
jgi:outer membrane scaffolding protein for murein synthesis (MipA/OmpV family)